MNPQSHFDPSKQKFRRPRSQVSIAEIVLRDGGPEKRITLFWSVAAKRLTFSKLIDGLPHRRDGRSRQRFCHVANAATNQLLFGARIGFAEFAHPSRDLREEITGLKL
jgi:hypothetical protein